MAHWRVSARIGQLPALARHLLVWLGAGVLPHRLTARTPRRHGPSHRYFGRAIIATRIHGDLLRRLFGAFLLIVSLHMIFERHGR